MTKGEILSEIQRVAAANNGAAPGMGMFEQETGVRRHDWQGVHWRSWGDAVREAGLTPNTLQPRIDDEEYLRHYALVTRDLGRMAVKADLQMARQCDSAIPSDNSYHKRFGSYAHLRSRVHAWCSEREEYADVALLLSAAVQASKQIKQVNPRDIPLGFVYLIKHGSRAEYKIGRTLNPIRREGEMRLQLPERVTPIHYIETDDPPGVEAYWHGRFAEKRKEGEWFVLSTDDVRAFKKWKKIS